MLLENDFDISKLTTFKIGGKVKTVYFPESIAEFVEVLKSNKDAKVFGNLSNTLVSSEGFEGVVVVTTKMNRVIIDKNIMTVDCGVKGPSLAKITCENELCGFEFMIGFPGSVGGNICMNASAHGQSISDKIKEIICYDGEIKTYTKEEMGFDYRKSRCMDEDLVILSAKFELDKLTKENIAKKMEENLAFRKSHQPSMALPNCGSVFKNPEGDSAGRLLDAVGAKSMSVGGVKVWEHHANFIVNTNGGTSLDVLELMSKMSSAVEEKFGIKLVPEVRFLGENNEKEVRLCKKLYQK